MGDWGQGDGWGRRFCPNWKSVDLGLSMMTADFCFSPFGLSRFSDCEPCMIVNNLL